MMIISVLLQTFLLANRCDKGSVQAWTPAIQLPTQVKRHSKLSLSSDSSAKADEKIYYQRFFYRFRPSSQVDIHDAMVIEERLRYANNKNDNDTFRPIGPRTLILRNGQVEDGEIGDEFFTLNVHEPSSLHPSASSIESALCTALYLASNPTLCTGTVLELSCQLGLAGLLGCLGAGYRLRETTLSSAPAETSVEDDILTLPHENANLLPPQLQRLILTDSDPDMINYAVHNVQNARIPANKVMLDQWDWTVPTPPLQQRAAMSRWGGSNNNNAKTGMPSSSASSPPNAIEYQTIVASDVAFSFPEAKQLARTVANALAPSNIFSLSPNDPPLPAPRFVHISPEARDNETPYLHRLLEKGYRMTVDTGFLKLEKIVFGVQTLSLSQADSLQHETAALDEMELEVKHVQESIYQSLTAIHHPDYAGEGSGEIFFPMETGAYS